AVPLYVIEALASVGGTILNVGAFFYMAGRFRWGLREEFQLAVVLGLVYTVGALLANRLAALVGRRAALGGTYAVLAVVLAAGLASASAAWVTAILLVYTFLIALTWPVLESLVASGNSGNDAAGM